jgi:hypothetical protein
MLPTKFLFILPNGFRAEESKTSANQKQESPVQPCLLQESPVQPCLLTDRDKIIIYGKSSMGNTHSVLIC